MWPELEELKAKLNSKKMRLVISLISKMDRGEFADSEAKRRKSFAKRFDVWMKHMDEIEVFLRDAVPFGSHDSIDLLLQFEDTKKSISEYLAKYQSEEIHLTERSGPKEYPTYLSWEIFKLLNSAKGDSSKLKILIEYFSPSGEFDTWLTSVTGGRLRGPQRTSRQDEIESYEDDRKWLNDFKARIKKQLKRFLAEINDAQ
nr:hypothetical protein [uncultured Bdellovibrio sp.]